MGLLSSVSEQFVTVLLQIFKTYVQVKVAEEEELEFEGIEFRQWKASDLYNTYILAR